MYSQVYGFFYNSLVLDKKNGGKELNIRATVMEVQVNIHHRPYQKEWDTSYFTDGHKG